VRPDLLPPSALAEFELLQDRAEPLPIAVVRDAVEGELGAPVTRLFRDFDEVPLASASVSQVHRAHLPDGEPVAVKVQRPGAAEALLGDLRLAGWLFPALVRASPLGRRLDAAALWGEILETCEAELDFRREAETTEEMSRRFRGYPGIRVPRVHWGWTSRRVLTTEFIEGTKISSRQARKREDYARLAEVGARAFLKQVLEDGLFHADLHPANLLITPEGEIAYLDFGIVGRLSSDERDHVLGALAGLLARDPLLAVRHLGHLGVHVPGDRLHAFAREVAHTLDAALGPVLGQVSLARVGRGILAAVHRHRVVFPRKYALLIKALITIEGTARLLHPDFAFEVAAREYLTASARRTLSVAQVLEAGWRGLALLGAGALTPPTETVPRPADRWT